MPTESKQEAVITLEVVLHHKRAARFLLALAAYNAITPAEAALRVLVENLKAVEEVCNHHGAMEVPRKLKM